MILTREFYLQNPMDATRQLLGAYLCRRDAAGNVIRARIAEVELYLETEQGCHAFGGKCTPRNDAMFMDGGHAYVYLCYGMHNMLNIVFGRAGVAAAALVRAVEMDGCNGPGKLCRTLGITRADNKLDLTRGDKMWIESNDGPPPQIAAGVRIGIDYAGADAKLPWRFVIADSPYISRPIES
ncbi:MAG: DNA-3-methyladenine glycosylase [Alphaproteobacteria bacterium]|nr:DNA-3-methyladenine glycosylase [Alphaproteobacteria bacterium]